MADNRLDNEAREEFLEESREHLDAIEPDLLTLERSDAGVPDTVNRLFRAIHSIKGASPFLGCEALKNLSHVMESLLMKFRDGERDPDPDTVDALLAGVDKLRLILGDLDHGDAISCDAEISSLQSFLGVDAPAPAPQEKPGSRKPARTNSRRAKLQAKLGIAAKLKRDKVRAPVSSAGTPQETPVASTARSPVPATKRSHAETIRVSVELIDRLINLAGELVLGRNQFRGMLQNVSGDVPGLPAALQNMDRVTSDLQEDIMRMRMQPVATLFNKLPRIVRDLSRSLGKRIEILVDGGDVELDRSILEGLSDPLTHLLRNSVDHGIGTPEEREAAGKSATGQIQVRAAHEGGQVVVTIADDGRGIDPEKVASRAVTRGLLSEERARSMSDKEKQNLIFAPGFSTAETVSEVSGRGVGMDVVKTNIERLGGHVEVESAVGQGTTIHLRLPLTLAIIPALVVGAARQRFAIPQVNVRELVRIRGNELAKRVERVGDADVLRLRNQLLPVVRLDHVLQAEGMAPTGADDVHVVVMRYGKDCYGLLVDELFSTEEIVVKPLSRYTEGCRIFSGTTIMGDGVVAMILDATGIAEVSALRFSELDAERRRLQEEEEARVQRQLAEQRRLVILFESAPGERFAIPVSAVARLERLTAPRFEYIGRREYVRVRDESVPLFRLESILPVTPFPEGVEEIFLVMPKYDGPPLGIAVSRIIDTVQTSDTLQQDKIRPVGLLGTAMVEDVLTSFLDVPALLAAYESRLSQNCGDGER